MTIQDVGRIAAGLFWLFALDFAVAALAVSIRDNWPIIRAALRGEPIPRPDDDDREDRP